MDLEQLKQQIFKRDFYEKSLVFFLGVFLLALNYNLFFLPNHLVIGGTSGLSIIFEEIFGWDPNIFLYISGLILIILCYIFLGKKNTGVSIIGSIMYPFMISLTYPLAKLLQPYFTFDNIVITIILTSLLYGIANGMIYKVGFNTGGFDILMKIFNKYGHIPEGKASLILNSIIILFGGIAFGVHQVVYAIIILAIYSRIVDSILIGISNSKLFFIYTKEHQKVRKYIIEEMKTGVTILETEGGYSKKKGYMLMCVVPTKDYYYFKEMVLYIDPSAFFVIHDCYEVQGGKRRNLPFLMK